MNSLGTALESAPQRTGARQPAKTLRRCLSGLLLLSIGFVLGGLGLAAWQARQGPEHCWEATVYLPLAGNDGRPFADAELPAAVGRRAADFGGATAGAPREGYGLDDRGQVRREPVRPVVITFAR